jgi:uncharacterized membrane protein
MKSKSKAAVATPEPASRARQIIYIAIAVLAAVGIAETTYLTALNLAGAHVTCVTAANCSAVLGSAYAKVGPVPLASIGALGYLAAFSFSILAAFGYRRAPLLLGLTVGVMFLTTLWLLYLQAFVLHAFCDYCLFSAALIFLLSGLLIAAPPERRS